MATKMMKFKISGTTVFMLSVLYALFTQKRPGTTILELSHHIMMAVDRIMMCDYISLFIVFCYLAIFGVIIPFTKFEFRVYVE